MTIDDSRPSPRLLPFLFLGLLAICAVPARAESRLYDFENGYPGSILFGFPQATATPDPFYTPKNGTYMLVPLFDRYPYYPYLDGQTDSSFEGPIRSVKFELFAGYNTTTVRVIASRTQWSVADPTSYVALGATYDQFWTVPARGSVWVTIPSPEVRNLRIVPASTSSPYFAIDNFSFEYGLVTPPAEQIRATASVVSSEARPCDTKTASAILNDAGGPDLRIPLGCVVQLHLSRTLNGGGEQDASGTFRMSVFSEPDATVSGPLQLLRGEVAIVVGDRLGSRTELLALRLGKQTLHVNVGTKDYEAPVLVYMPASMGTKKQDYDRDIFKYASRAGLSPQLLKAQIAQETTQPGQGFSFDPKTYRYEPLSIDYKELYSLNWRTRSDYLPFLLETPVTDGSLPEGGSIRRPSETEYRNRFEVLRAGDVDWLSISESDSHITIQQIVEGNDGDSKCATDPHCLLDLNPHPPLKMNWLKQEDGNGNGAAYIRYDPSILNVTAQTVLAGSYGLMQVLLTTALDQDYWNGCGADHHKGPDSLIDAQANLGEECSTLSLGTMYTIARYAGSKHEIFPVIQSTSDLDTVYNVALRRYNGKAVYPKEIRAKLLAYPSAYFKIHGVVSPF